VHLSLRNEAQLDKLIALQSTPKSPLYHHWLTPAQFRASFGPTPATIAKVSAFLRSQGFTITKVETQLIHVQGTIASVERAFKVHLGNVRLADRTILGSREQVTVPSALSSGVGATIVSLGYRILPQPQSHIVNPQNRYAANGPYWFDDLKQAYNYPAYGTLNGAGVTIATVGYSDFSSSDAAQYFGHELLGSPAGSLAPAPVPTHLVFPQSEAFNPNFGTSDEADLDVQMSAGSAPGANVIGIAAPATDAEGFLYAYSYIVDSNAADIVSTSYGECELFYLPEYNMGESFVDILYSYSDMFKQGVSQGITFIFSSGDDSGRPCPNPNYFYNAGAGASYLDYPGTSIWSDDPNVTSVGGTNLETVPNPNPTASPLAVTSSAYVSEEAYADEVLSPIDPYGEGNFITNDLWGSGGGPSVIFGEPAYQFNSKVGVPSTGQRYDPDISMHMGGCPYYQNPLTGRGAEEKCRPQDSYDVAVIGGNLVGLIGTSASAPEFAGLLAVYEQSIGSRVGNFNYFLYGLAEDTLGEPTSSGGPYHQGIPGFNGVVTVPSGQIGYNEIIGLGTPDGVNFLQIPTAPTAGNPQTPSNP
jgi:subtilase family serine protease